MGNSRSLRRRLAASREARQSRPRFNIRDYPDTPPPAVATVRTWLRKAEAQGLVERKGVEHTGRAGRPAVLWGLPETDGPEGNGAAEDAPRE
jgi:hypothetical protein